MNKLVSTLVFLSWALLSYSQNDWSLQDYAGLNDSMKTRLGLVGENYYNSNVLNNSFYFNALFGTGITRTEMESTAPRVFGKNIVGAQEIDRLYVSWFGRENNTVHSVNVGTRRFVHALFGKDAYNLFAFGNKGLAGQTAELSGTTGRLMQYTQVEYSIHKTTNKEHKWGLGAAFVMGNRYLEVDSRNSGLYTSSIGDSVYLYVDGYFRQSDTSINSVYGIAGYGAMVDFYYDIPVDWFKKQDEKGSLKIEVNDLGFVWWNNNTQQYNLDGDIDWAGVKAPSIFDIGDSIYRDQVPSDIDEELIREVKRSSYITDLAPRIAIYYSERINRRLEIKNMIDYRFNSNYLPYLAATQSFQVSKQGKAATWKVNAYQSLGGFGYLGLGVGGEVSHKNFGAHLGTRHLFGLTNPGFLSGFNIHLGFHWNFY